MQGHLTPLGHKTGASVPVALGKHSDGVSHSDLQACHSIVLTGCGAPQVVDSWTQLTEVDSSLD